MTIRLSQELLVPSPAASSTYFLLDGLFVLFPVALGVLDQQVLPWEEEESRRVYGVCEEVDEQRRELSPSPPALPSSP